ncbi:hypothetical protein I7I48_01471 [Histoplasma ohiense]|nr:hypothetical protein I7I48_01471 [Histoplasma ohiense (nom. inval.)]
MRHACNNRHAPYTVPTGLKTMGLIFQDNSLQNMRRLRAGAGVNPGDLEPWAEGVLLRYYL